MMLSPPLDSYHDDEILDALELIERSGPYPPTVVQLIRNLHVLRYADVRVNERRQECGAIVTDIVSARLTDRGRALLEALRA